MLPQCLVVRSKRPEIQEQVRAQMDAQGELHNTLAALNQASDGHEEEATPQPPLHQQVSELIERIRRMEQVVNDHPPDYES